MKKTICTFLTLAITLLFVGCSQQPTNNPSDSQQPSAAQSFTRKNDFPLNYEVQKYINPDDEYIALIDALYVAATDSFENLRFDESVYDAAVALSEKQNAVFTTLLENNDDDFRQWYLTCAFDGTFGLNEIIVAGYENAIGAISNEAALIKELRAADRVLSFYYYSDYSPIFLLPEYSSADIIEDFSTNELAADNAYSNRLVTVNGYVQDITKDVFDQYYVSLGGYSKYGDELRCYFDESFEEAIISLSKGDRVSFIVCINGKDTFDINATLWDIPSPKIEEDASFSDSKITDNNALFGVLDLLTVWNVRWNDKHYEHIFHYAFLEDGTCYVVVSSGSWTWGGGSGTYQVRGNTIEFDIVVDGCRFIYGFDYDPAANQLTHTHGTPIIAESAAANVTYLIEEDSSNDVAKIIDIAQSFVDNNVDLGI